MASQQRIVYYEEKRVDLPTVENEDLIADNKLKQENKTLSDLLVQLPTKPQEYIGKSSYKKK